MIRHNTALIAAGHRCTSLAALNDKNVCPPVPGHSIQGRIHCHLCCSDMNDSSFPKHDHYTTTTNVPQDKFQGTVAKHSRDREAGGCPVRPATACKQLQVYMTRKRTHTVINTSYLIVLMVQLTHSSAMHLLGQQ